MLTLGTKRLDNAMYYLLTIAEVRKNLRVCHGTLQACKAALEEKGVHFIDEVTSDHGRYRQKHLHAIVQYAGRFRGLTKMQFIVNVPPIEPHQNNFKIHWKPLSAGFSIEDACNYLNRNEKPVGMRDEENIIRDAQTSYMFIN